MFWTYTLKDVVEIEPVYFPSPALTESIVSAREEPYFSSHRMSSRRDVAEDPPHPPLPAVVIKICKPKSEEGEDGSVEAKRILHYMTSTTAMGTSSSREDEQVTEIPVRSMVAPSISVWADIILHRLTERYVGKVVPRLGFCVVVDHLLEYTPCEIKGPHASAWVTAVFEICVFAPVPLTRFRAKIVAQDPSGMYVSIDFFEAYRIFIPAAELVEGSTFDPTTGRWYLPMSEEEEEREPEEEEENAKPSMAPDTTAELPCNYYMHQEDVIAKVLHCVIAGNTSSAVPHNEDGEEGLMSITASFRGDCLGPVSWFDEVGEEEA